MRLVSRFILKLGGNSRSDTLKKIASPIIFQAVMAAEAHPRCDNSESCYCRYCHDMRLQLYTRKEIPALEVDLHRACLDEVHFNRLSFSEVLKQICVSKAFKMKVEARYHYKKMAPFFKTVWGETPKNAKLKANKINNNTLVYDQWQIILNNLSVCPLINLKQLSANQLFLARTKGWCHSYNELQRSRGNRPAILAYSEEDYQDLLISIRNHPAFQAIDKSEENDGGLRDISALTLRIGRDLQHYR